MAKRILVPIDFSDFSLRALEFALELRPEAAGETTEFILLHVYEPPRLGRPDLTTWTEVEGRMVPLAQLVKEEATAKLSKLVEETASRTGVRAVAEVEEGRAVSTIVDAAKRHGCDLIVLGTHGRASG
jgi:nucleotide-binding universal stress UspA family protein